MASFQANGQPLDWHFFHRAGHGFAMADGDCYDPALADTGVESDGEFPRERIGKQLAERKRSRNRIYEVRRFTAFVPAWLQG